MIIVILSSDQDLYDCGEFVILDLLVLGFKFYCKLQRIDEMGKDDGAKPQAKNHGLFDFLHGLLDFLPWKKDEKENPDYKDVDGKPKFSWKTPIETVARIYKSFLEQWPPPGARFGRALEWRSDEEFARSVSSCHFVPLNPIFPSDAPSPPPPFLLLSPSLSIFLYLWLCKVHSA